VSKLRGLPPEKKMRHDSHFVEEITSQRGDAIGQLINIQQIDPNPHQPRRHFGDLSDMVASFAAMRVSTRSSRGSGAIRPPR